MKYSLSIIIAALFALIGNLLFINYASVETAQEPKQMVNPANEDKPIIKPAALYWEALLANPRTGKFDIKDVLKARQMADAMRNHSNSRQPALNLQWEIVGPSNIGGRTRAILVDQNNSNKVYAGGVTGSLLVSDDGGDSWYAHPSFPSWDRQGISCLKQAPNGDIYFGTGESFVVTLQNYVGHFGGGIYRSTDNGQTFQVLPTTIPNLNDERDHWAWVNEIAIDPNNSNRVFAALGYKGSVSRSGLYVSNDSGYSWNKITSGLYFVDTMRYSSEVAINSNGVVMAVVNGKYYRSVNGIDFTLIADTMGFPSPGVTDRIEFAIAPTDPNYVYAAISNKDRNTYGILQSTDGGLNWIPYSPINDTSFNPLGEQGFYNIAFAVNPNDKNEVFLGGQLKMYKGSLNQGYTLIAEHHTPTAPNYIHADMHTITFDPTSSNVMYVGSDGGIYKTTNAQNSSPTFSHKNNNYFYAAL